MRMTSERRFKYASSFKVNQIFWNENRRIQMPNSTETFSRPEQLCSSTPSPMNERKFGSINVRRTEEIRDQLHISQSF